MKLNAVEKILMNNPLRAFAQNNIEAQMFEKLGGKTKGQKVLEIGCGRGVGTKIILNRFGASEVHAFDLDPQMIELAENRYIPLWQNSVKEVARVLKPNGKFYFEEVTQKGLNRWFYRTFLKHPTENRFSGEKFIADENRL